VNITGLHVERWPIDQLIPYIRHARTHSPEQVAQVAASMIECGWTNPILVGGDRVVIAGHARLLTARKLGMDEVPVIVLSHLSEAQRRALVLTDNKLALNAGWDVEMLRVELDSLEDDGFNLEVIGFSDEALEEILREPEETREGLTDEDAAPEPPERRPVTVAGDLWVLGKHRVLCGDASDLEAVRRLVAGERADLVFTDPPYNVDYEGYTADKLTIKGDRMKPEEFDRFLRGAFSSYRA
jgi:ParB-like chromosome segregation protein Spo0J